MFCKKPKPSEKYTRRCVSCVLPRNKGNKRVETLLSHPSVSVCPFFPGVLCAVLWSFVCCLPRLNSSLRGEEKKVRIIVIASVWFYLPSPPTPHGTSLRRHHIARVVCLRLFVCAAFAPLFLSAFHGKYRSPSCHGDTPPLRLSTRGDKGHRPDRCSGKIVFALLVLCFVSSLFFLCDSFVGIRDKEWKSCSSWNCFFFFFVVLLCCGCIYCHSSVAFWCSISATVSTTHTLGLTSS